MSKIERVLKKLQEGHVFKVHNSPLFSVQILTYVFRNTTVTNTINKSYV